MTRALLIILIAVCVASATAVRSQSLELPALEVRLENYLRAAAFDEDALPILNNPMYFANLRLADGPTGLNGLLATYPMRLYGMEPYELSHVDAALEGIGPAMTMGLLLGAVGTTSGLWDEEGAWYLAGGAAAIGALLGVRKAATDPGWRIRYRWKPPPGHDGADQLHDPARR
jgi:hypothetical protein